MSECKLSHIRIVHVSTIHRRGDVRIFVKEAQTLARELDAEVIFCVQDGGSDQDGPVRVVSSGEQISNTYKRLTIGIWRMYCKIRQLNPQVVHLHDPELIPLGILLKFHGIKVVQDIHEDYRQVIKGSRRLSPLVKSAFYLVVAAFERLAISFFDGVVCATDRIARNFPSGDLIAIKNFPEIGEFAATASIAYKARGRNVVYIGGVSKIRGAFEMVEAIERVRNPETKLLLAGVFQPNELREKISSLPGWRRVDFLGWVGRKDAACIFSRSRIGLVILHPHGNYVESLPTKMFEYMAAGIPVVMSDFPFFQELIKKYKCGLVTDPLDPASIARAIDWLLDHPEEAEEMGRRGRDAVENELNWTIEGRKLVSFYQDKLAIPLKLA
jgi:glycosyltransferase involved in cell wall biosynthesis